MGSICSSTDISAEKHLEELLLSIADDTPLFSIGIIADPQYADHDDGQNFTKTRTRRYRQALTITQNAIEIWNDDSKCRIRPSLVMCMGDMIDLLNVESKASETAMATMMDAFSKFTPPSTNSESLSTEEVKSSDSGSNSKTDDNDIKDDAANDSDSKNKQWIGFPYFHNCVGNHEMYNFNREQLTQYQRAECIQQPIASNDDNDNDNNGNDDDDDHSNNMNGGDTDYIFYYSFHPFDGHLFIVLDAYVVSIMGYSYCDNKHRHYQQAVKLLDKYNPNENKNVPPKPTKEVPDLDRFTAFNGGFGEEQLQWLESELKKARERKDKVFIFSHIPLIYTNNPKSPHMVVAWDYKECLEIVDKYNDVIKIFFAGHEHDGDKKVHDDNEIVHRTLEGVIESGEGQDCFATVYFYEDKVFIDGYGKVAKELYSI